MVEQEKEIVKDTPSKEKPAPKPKGPSKMEVYGDKVSNAILNSLLKLGD